jgi:hypothetical protein
MISIGKYLDEHDIAQEMRLERKLHKGSFLVLEGDTDIKRFRPFIDDDKCSLVNSYGRRNAIEAIKLLYEDGFPGAVAVADVDFDRVTGTLEEHEGIVYSQTHDLDLDWARPRVVARYLWEVGDKSKCDTHGDVGAIIHKILEGLKPISVARLLGSTRRIRYRLGNIDASKVFVNFCVDLDAYIDLVFDGRVTNTGEKETLKEAIARACQKGYDLYQLTNGHDFYCALGSCLRSELGFRRDFHSWRSEIEKDLRLAFSDGDFRETEVYRGLCGWINENRGYVIFDVRLNAQSGAAVVGG